VILQITFKGKKHNTNGIIIPFAAVFELGFFALRLTGSLTLADLIQLPPQG
jgi:hypothetical protein